MARSGRPITLPGLWGPLATRVGGVQALARILGAPERSLRNYACNDRTMDAIVASKAEDIGAGDFVQVYRDPDEVGFHVGSAPEGWVKWPAAPGGWAQRSAWEGKPTGLVRGDTEAARAHGWPW